MSTRSFGIENTGRNPYFPRLLGRNGAVATEHYLSAQAAADCLKNGGNAVDAAVCATLVENVVNPNMFTLGGECPMLIRMASDGKVVSVNGNTAAPELATPQAFLDRGLTDIPPESMLTAGVPAVFHALLTVLERFGRLRFAEVSQAARNYAAQGFPVHKGLRGQPKFGLSDLADKFRAQWPGSAALYLPGGKVPAEGAEQRNPAQAALFEALVAAEKKAGRSREKGLRAVRDEFYRGDVAAEVDRFAREHDSLLRRSDLERFETRLEEPARLAYRDTTVFKCGPWNQGPVLLQTLSILENFDLKAMGHNSADYLHTVVEAIKLSFADREQYYGDPAQVDVPLAALLSKEYGQLRAALMDMRKAAPELRPGDPRGGKALLAPEAVLAGRAWGPGTVHVDVIDKDGNMAAFTPSGAWIRNQPVIPALGFPLSNRMQTFYLGPDHHPNVVAPFKRPRTTISPSLAYRQGKPWMVFGSMGGDQQDQWMLQFFLARADFGMSVQAAIESAKFSSEHFPGFFAPHDFIPNRLRIEPRVGQATLDELARRGHDLEVSGDWNEGYLLAVAKDDAPGWLEAGCDPRGEKSEVFPSYALAW
ncbi:MAG: gamma-glutamyltransferase family protein [Deltaproteobacteria bacterium]|nr:gamma-glutamyltransferase family protein [Deltaproteobacteria bacterium]